MTAEPGALAASHARRPLRAAAVIGVLGVVYGDIGTSPLYALKASLTHFTAPGVGRAEILGVLSLIFWALVLTVTVKYVALVMRADNNGEGGILALMAVAQRGIKGSRMRGFMGLVGIGGACLFFGDGVITPAISVLSAVEGLGDRLPRVQTLRHPHLRRRDPLPFRRPGPRHRDDRPPLRPGDGGLVPRHRGAWDDPDRRPPHNPGRPVTHLWASASATRMAGSPSLPSARSSWP